MKGIFRPNLPRISQRLNSPYNLADTASPYKILTPSALISRTPRSFVVPSVTPSTLILRTPPPLFSVTSVTLWLIFHQYCHQPPPPMSHATCYPHTSDFCRGRRIRSRARSVSRSPRLALSFSVVCSFRSCVHRGVWCRVFHACRGHARSDQFSAVPGDDGICDGCGWHSHVSLGGGASLTTGWSPVGAPPFFYVRTYSSRPFR